MKKILAIIALFTVSLLFSQTENTKPNKEFKDVMKRADSCTVAKDHKSAIAFYTEALQYDIEKEDVLFRRTMGYFSIKDYVPAVTGFTELIEMDTKKAGEYYFMRGMSIFSQNNSERPKGCDDIRKAIELGYNADWAVFQQFCD